MKTNKVRGEGFSVRFTRRPSFGKKDNGLAAKNAAQDNGDVMTKEEPVMQDVPDQVPDVVQDGNVQVSANSSNMNSSTSSDASSKEGKMQIALWQAAMTGDCYAIRLLVMEGVDLEARDPQGRTAINIATQYNQQNALKTLLAAREMKRMAKIGDLPNSQFFRKFSQKTAV